MAEYDFDKEEVVENSIKTEEVVQDPFEILSKTIEVRGKYAEYKIENKVMTVDDKHGFMTIEEIRDWGRSEREELEKKIALIRAKEDEAVSALIKFM